MERIKMQIWSLTSCKVMIFVFHCEVTCQVTCWLCLSADPHHLNALGSSVVCCHLPDPLRSWFRHRGGQMGWQETLTADHSEPPTVRWAQSREEPSLCSAKRHRQGLVVTMINELLFILKEQKRWAIVISSVRSVSISLCWHTVHTFTQNSCWITCLTKPQQQFVKEWKMKCTKHVNLHVGLSFLEQQVSFRWLYVHLLPAAA